MSRDLHACPVLHGMTMTRVVASCVAQFHYLHHARFECNYGSASVPLDALFGVAQLRQRPHHTPPPRGMMRVSVLAAAVPPPSYSYSCACTVGTTSWYQHPAVWCHACVTQARGRAGGLSREVAIAIAWVTSCRGLLFRAFAPGTLQDSVVKTATYKGGGADYLAKVNPVHSPRPQDRHRLFVWRLSRSGGETPSVCIGLVVAAHRVDFQGKGKGTGTGQRLCRPVAVAGWGIASACTP